MRRVTGFRFDETKPNHRGICWIFSFDDARFEHRRPNPRPLPLKWKGSRKQTDIGRGPIVESEKTKPNNPRFYKVLKSRRLPLVCHPERGRRVAKRAKRACPRRPPRSDLPERWRKRTTRRIERPLKVKKQSHFMPDFKGFSSLIPLPLQGKGLGVRSARPLGYRGLLVGVVRERPAAVAQSRRSSAPATSLRAVHEPPLPGNRSGHPNTQKQSHFIPDFQGFFLSGSPSLKGKGLGVRSARHRCAETLRCAQDDRQRDEPRIIL